MRAADPVARLTDCYIPELEGCAALAPVPTDDHALLYRSFDHNADPSI